MVRIGMGTTSVLPQRLDDAFRLAAEVGFDGIEVMITSDRNTQRAETLQRLSDRYALPVLSVHAPVLVFSSFVWGRSPLVKLERSCALAAELGASTVVAHPPYAWQCRSAEHFVSHVRTLEAHFGLVVAVENMFPVAGARRRDVFAPHWNPGELDIAHLTLDFSHAGMAGIAATELSTNWGERLSHIHLCDASRATAGPSLINTRACGRDERMRVARLDETLRFARRHLPNTP